MKNVGMIVVFSLFVCSYGLAEDLVVNGTSLVIDSDRDIDGSIFVENGGSLTIRNATVTLILDFDEEHHVDVSDSSQLIIENSVIRSVGGQFWFELYGDGVNNPTMHVSGADSWLTNHSGIRPFDQTRITVTGGDVEEIQVRDQVQVELSNAGAYPVFFFDGVTADISGLYTDVDYTITNDLDFTGVNSWRFKMTNAWIEGYQIDLMNGSDVTLNDSDGIVLSIHTPGNLGPDLKIVEGLTADTRIPSGLTTNLGNRFEFTDCNIALINVYVFGEDRVLLRNMHINEVNAEGGSELLIGGNGTNTVLNCNLCQVYDHATFTVDSAVIDGSENVPSATAAFDSVDSVGTGIMTFREMDLNDLFLTVIQEGTIRIHNSAYDPEKLSVLDATATFEDYTLQVDFSATPLSGTAPLVVDFTDQSVGQTAAFEWLFGDGATSSEQDPSHTYRNAGTYSVTLNVTGPAGSNTASKSDFISVTDVVAGNCDNDPIFVAAAAHAAGAEDSTWRSDVSVFNASDQEMNLALRFFSKDQDNTQAACVSVGAVSPWAAVFFEDVVAAIFGVQSGVGGIAVYSDSADLIVMSRTYNVGVEGTFGQSIPGRLSSEAISDGDVSVLVQLHENEAYRTNVGFLNPSASPVDVIVSMYGESGQHFGDKPLTLLPFEQRQLNRVFTTVTSQDVKNGRVEIAANGGPVLAYASVVDNGTQDPSYVEPW